MSTPAPQLLWRLVLLGLLTAIVQIAGVSQVPIFGVTADLAPLVVGAVGLLAGAVAGMTTGFALGVLVDLALSQSVGVTSLVLVAAGYGAGRLRELRDPGHGLTPLAVGAGATAIATVGFAIIEFLLGVDAPVSWLLLRDIVLTILLNSVLALPVHAVVRRLLAPALPHDPRRRRRRAYTTGGLSPISRA